jgi:hypothetical protein
MLAVGIVAAYILIGIRLASYWYYTEIKGDPDEVVCAILSFLVWPLILLVVIGCKVIPFIWRGMFKVKILNVLIAPPKSYKIKQAHKKDLRQVEKEIVEKEYSAASASAKR